MRSLLKKLLEVFYPKTCVTCDHIIRDNEGLVCHFCRISLPYSNHFELCDNELKEKLSVSVNLQYAAALFYYKASNEVHHLIHKLKYKNQTQIGAAMGVWIAEKIRDNNWQIDAVVSVPIHPKRKQKRGYNQLTQMGISIAHLLNIPYYEDALLRVKYTQSQSQLKRKERLQLAEDNFALNTKINLVGLHVIIIDDVITTGSTIINCIKLLQKHQNIKVSVASIALTQ